jgi:serine/threonine-protein kinase
MVKMGPQAVTVRYCSRCKTSYADERFCPIDGGVIVEAREAGDPLIGQTLAGRYLMMRAIGQGGMGAVYEAEHVGLGKRVAVKILLDSYTDDREVLARFHQEARTASRIGHENIIDILDIGTDESGHAPRTFIAMELLDGQDLRGLVREVGALPIGQGIHIVKQICRALEAAHAKDVIHRDMKPENVFLTARSGQRDFVKIMDFGISKIKAAHESQVRLTQTGAVIGTPLYMAPEQALGRTDIDQRADIYSVGVMMYELFTGRPPFEAPTYLALMAQHMTETPVPPRKLRPDLPAALDKAILRTLEKEPERRFQSMRELERAMPEVAYTPRAISPPTLIAGSNNTLTPHSGELAPRAASTKLATMVKGRSRARAYVIGAVGVLIAGGAVAGILVFGHGSTKSDAPKGEAAKEEKQPAQQPSVDGPKVTAMEDVGSLEVESSPAGAAIFLDGVEKGKTPLLIDKVSAGTHKLKLELPGYATIEVSKAVRADNAEDFFASMSPTGKGGSMPHVKSSVLSSVGTSHETPHDTPHDTQPVPQAQVQTPVKQPTGDPRDDTKPQGPALRPAIDASGGTNGGAGATNVVKPKQPPSSDDDDKKKNPYLNR